MERKKIRQGPLFKKTRGKKNIIYIYIRIWTAGAIHMLRGLNVDAHFWQKGPMAEEAQQYEKDGEREW